MAHPPELVLICAERQNAKRLSHGRKVAAMRLEGDKLVGVRWGRWDDPTRTWIVAVCATHGWLRIPEEDVVAALRARKGRLPMEKGTEAADQGRTPLTA